MVKQNNIIQSYFHQKSGKTIEIRCLDPAQDLEQLFQWTHNRHVIPYWQLNKPKSELYKYLRKANENRHQAIFIVAVDGREICYVETYQAKYDRLANFFQVNDGDYGLHLFIGPVDAIGKGYSELILCAITDLLFTNFAAKRVLVEPNQKVRQLTILERKLGFLNLGTLVLPEKKATVYAATAEEFYKHYPKVVRPLNIDRTKISCDASAWPIVRVHFPDHPEDTMLLNWLKELDKLLERQNPCVVIATFDPHYQYSPSARRYQAVWFKQNTARLAHSCLAMVRVTRDQQMIAKITSNAMRQGMPFICIPADSIRTAEFIAKRILLKHKITPCEDPHD